MLYTVQIIYLKVTDLCFYKQYIFFYLISVVVVFQMSL